jgi:hypothetical protein
MKQFVVGMVWLPAVWKSTFARKIVNKFEFSHINKDEMRIFFRDKIKYFNTADHSYSNDTI